MKQGYPIIYMDESGFEAEIIRPYGYAPIGKPCIDSYNWQGKRKNQRHWCFVRKDAVCTKLL